MARNETTHAAPKAGQAETSCCFKSPLELPIKDRITLDPAKVTCGKQVARSTRK